MKLNDFREGLTSLFDSVSEGWQHLRQSASTALTWFKPDNDTNLPSRGDVDDVFYLPSVGWSMLGGDVFEDDKRIVVRLEAPGLEKQDFAIEVQGQTLTIRGEKRFERESSEGRYRVLQCAYGSFQRVFSLPALVEADRADAAYKNGVLRVELPKLEAAKPRKMNVPVN